MTGIKEMIIGVTVGHGQEVGERMTIPTDGKCRKHNSGVRGFFWQLSSSSHLIC
jgi:hypothetical protein